MGIPDRLSTKGTVKGFIFLAPKVKLVIWGQGLLKLKYKYREGSLVWNPIKSPKTYDLILSMTLKLVFLDQDTLEVIMEKRSTSRLHNGKEVNKEVA